MTTDKAQHITKPKRGGKREGSGRKKDPSKRLIVYVKVGILTKLGGLKPVRKICYDAIFRETDKAQD